MTVAIRLLSTLLLLGCALPSVAAPAAAGDKESTYDIEVLVFENRLPDLIGDELLARDAGETRRRAVENAVSLAPLPGESYFQPAIARLLEKDGHYRVLASHHWLETLDAKTVTKPVRIESAKPGEIEGSIRFYMSRYLHLDVNLQFREAAGADKAVPVTYRISEQRRIKSQETNYFDHPKFGVLVRVMPVETDAKEKVKGAR